MRFTEHLIEVAAKLFFGMAALLLLVFSASLIGVAVHQFAYVEHNTRHLLDQTLDSIGLVTIAVAVFEVAKFLIEEELLRSRELRSITDARLALTKFFTIIIIVLAIEGVVLIFETKLDQIQNLLYPTALLATVMLILVGLGLFRWLTDLGTPPKIEAEAEIKLDREARGVSDER